MRPPSGTALVGFVESRKRAAQCEQTDVVDRPPHKQVTHRVGCHTANRLYRGQLIGIVPES